MPRTVLVVAVLVVLALGWTAWLAWQTERDLQRADAAVDRLQAALETGDDGARDAAASDLGVAAAAAADRTDGTWWAAMTVFPIYGDDAAGIEALSASVDVLANNAIAPLIETADSLDGVITDGRVNIDQVTALGVPVTRAAAAMRTSLKLTAAEDSSGFVSALRTRYDDYTGRLRDVAADFGSAETAVEVLPDILGASGPRDYLFIFQNNAEIRSTGGLPGSWARLHVEDGKVSLREQGSAQDFLVEQPVTQLTPEELAVYDELPVLFFQDPTFIPDFPRAAQIFNAFWETKYANIDLDGVITLDPVAMSYLLAGTGPIAVDGLTLTPENLVDELLSKTYLTIQDPAEQDRRFEEVARAIFKASTTQLVSPTDFVQGVSQAAREGRFLYAPFNETDATRLTGVALLGDVSGQNGATPRVEVGLNDATGSKMSYYLRYAVEVKAQACDDDRQRLLGTATLTQVISPRDALKLPDYVTGGDAYGIPIGSQLVTLRIYGPQGGLITNVRIDGRPLEVEEGLEIDGRPVVTAAPLLESPDDVVLTWDMVTGPGQTAAGKVNVTPSIVPGNSDSQFTSAC